MKDIFIADAHLRDPADENYRRLLAFLNDQQGKIRTLVLLGDIFEFWWGYRHVVFTSYIPFLETLRRLREGGTEIVFVEGNHDFHMGPFFTDTLGARVLPDGGALELNGRRIYIAHGDLANPRDSGYRLLRRFLRSRLLGAIAAIIPPDWAWSISRWAGNRSQRGHDDRRARWSPRELIREHAREHFRRGFDTVVTGHFHEPFEEVEGSHHLIALGDWISQYSYAIFENGQFTLENLD